jgi:flagellar hook-length control protein FliK
MLGTKSNETKNYLGKDNIASNLDQTNQDGNRPNQMVDLSKSESLVDQSQTSNKTSTNRSMAPETSHQNSQNAYETQLKLLEKNWGKDLAKIIERAIVSGKEKINISLDPQKLGKMHLTLSVVNNQTSIFITTENAATSLILNSAEDRLAQMFESSGYKLSNFQANSNANHNSNRNGSSSKQNKETKKIDTISDKSMLPEENNTTSKTLDGRKIINIIA